MRVTKSSINLQKTSEIDRLVAYAAPGVRGEQQNAGSMARRLSTQQPAAVHAAGWYESNQIQSMVSTSRERSAFVELMLLALGMLGAEKKMA